MTEPYFSEDGTHHLPRGLPTDPSVASSLRPPPDRPSLWRGRRLEGRGLGPAHCTREASRTGQVGHHPRPRLAHGDAHQSRGFESSGAETTSNFPSVAVGSFGTSPGPRRFRTPSWPGRQRDTVIWAKKLPRNEPGRLHPTQKPQALMEWCLSLFPDANTVVDPYMGSGTTLVAAKVMGLQAVGHRAGREVVRARGTQAGPGGFRFCLESASSSTPPTMEGAATTGCGSPPRHS